MISWSSSSPATRKERDTTIPPIEMTATSVVPPPRAWHGDDGLLVRFANEITEHRLGDFKFGNHAVAQRANRNNIGRGSANHFLGLQANSQWTARSFFYCHPGRLIDYDSFSPDVDQRIRCPQINPDVQREQSHQPIERIDPQYLLRLP